MSDTNTIPAPVKPPIVYNLLLSTAPPPGRLATPPGQSSADGSTAITSVTGLYVNTRVALGDPAGAPASDPPTQ